MPVSLDQFTQQVVACDLLSDSDVSARWAKTRTEQAPHDAESFAWLLVKQKKLSLYQALQIYTGKGKALVLGNYVVLEKLGQGGMGMVLKAEHRRLKRIVALKILSPELTKSPQTTRRFQREVEVTAKLDHPNIVAVFDADEVKGTKFLVMEFLEGTDLFTLVKQEGPLSVEKALHLLLQAARGLEYAHQRGVVHRDIKPANLLLDRQGILKIIDLGMARLESAEHKQGPLTSVGQIMGTADFMAPEQAVDSRIADARADIYALGITLWYLLTGRPAYEGDTVVKKLMAHQNAPIPSLRSACRQASPELEAVFEKMVAKTRESRYQSVTDLITDLERLRGQSLPAAFAAPFPEKDKRLSEFLRGIKLSNRPIVTKAARRRRSRRESPGHGRRAAFAVQPPTTIWFSKLDIHPPAQRFLIQPPAGETIKCRRRRFPGSRICQYWIVSAGLAMLLLLTGVLCHVQN